ncbi:MAG: hypothetical protein WD801_08170 [Gemmatimonadaceae bacterium]
MRAVARALVLASTVSCSGLEFVSPPADVPPELVISVVVHHRDETTLLLDAFFSSGTDAEGRSRQITDSTLVVAGTVVQPSILPASGNLRYSWQHVSAVAPMTVAVRSPVVAGLPLEPVMTIPLSRRTDSAARDLAEGDDLQLALPEKNTGDMPVDSWVVDVRRQDNAHVVSANGRGAGAGLVELPWHWLRAPVGDTLLVTYREMSSTERNVSYSLRVSRFTQVDWRIAIVAP